MTAIFAVGGVEKSIGAVTVDRANSRVTPIEFRKVCAGACARRGADTAPRWSGVCQADRRQSRRTVARLLCGAVSLW